MQLLRVVPIVFLMLASHSCETSVPAVTSADEPTAQETGTKANFVLRLTTDKSAYQPGETVTFSSSSDIPVPTGATVRYRTGATIVAEQDYTGPLWTWTPPTDDNTGYMVDVYTTDGQTETLLGTIAVDVSSDWATYPRYGFVATYDHTKTDDEIKQEMQFLRRCHINGVQFYDWQYKHHWPLGGMRGALLSEYTDIANRQVITSVVKKYIDTQHEYGMKAMFYNLCLGGLEDAENDGVSMQWGIFKSKNCSKSNQDKHSLPASWKSDIYLYNPADTSWQAYLAERNGDVYASFDFDGYHVDQLGNRGIVYDATGTVTDLRQGYKSFLASMKQAHPQKRMVMNAVAGWGAEQIAASEATDFMYNEMWDGENRFADLLTHKKNNDKYSGGKLATVFAAYMNYGKNAGHFNTPGILLTDAVMFAIGTSHLELGDHMLCNEYFPNANLSMDSTLLAALPCYYDFLVAYEQLLRGGGTEANFPISTTATGVSLNAWPPAIGNVTCYGKTVGAKKVIHLLNFRQANSLSWRDMDGTMPEPVAIDSLDLSIEADNVCRVWAASPDHLGGTAQELPFTQNGTSVHFTLPYLKYWTMVVLE